jgi:16S rRNA (cytidine1402-2'-O)-methyltransferase
MPKLAAAKYSTAKTKDQKDECLRMSEQSTRLDAALYVVATPLGNLRDITLRALDVLRAADLVAAEDTRVSRRLLSHYEIQKQVIALHEHNEAAAASHVIERLARGEAVAYVTDAGTPGISDPGVRLVRLVRDSGWQVVPIPGPSALTAALSAAGVDASQFAFYGFLPSRAGLRQKVLAGAAGVACTAVFYEAPHRLAATLHDMVQAFGPKREIVIARELTKMFESWHRCTLDEAPAWVEADATRSKGELVLIVGPQEKASETSAEAQAERVLELLMAEMPLSRAVALASEITHRSRNALYQRALELKTDA